MSAHIRAYRPQQAVSAPSDNALQIDWFLHERVPAVGVIAMQKVEGSNPFSRFL
jgi:hypothetical protein